MIQCKWVYHPESPGCKVMVCRNWWQRLVYPTDFATKSEVEVYQLWCTSNHMELENAPN